MATLRIGFPLPLHMLFSAPPELPKEQVGAGDKVYKIGLSLRFSYTARRIASGFCQKACGFATYACHPVILLYTF